MGNSNGAQATQTRAARQFGEMGKWAPYYDLVMALLTFGRERRLRQKQLEFCQLEPGQRVLEIGCGTGTLTMAAKSHVGATGAALGLDLAPEMIDAASRKATRNSVDVSFRQGSIARIPFPASHFDVILCSFMIFHMPEEVRKAGIAESHRVLKSGGYLCIIDGASLDKLASQLKESSFTEIQQSESKFGYMNLRFLRARADKA